MLVQFQPEMWFLTITACFSLLCFYPVLFSSFFCSCEKNRKWFIYIRTDELSAVVLLTWRSCSTTSSMCVFLHVCVCENTNHWHLQTCGIHTSSLLSPVAQWHTDHVWPRDNRPKPPSGHSCDPTAFPGNLCVAVFSARFCSVTASNCFVYIRQPTLTSANCRTKLLHGPQHVFVCVYTVPCSECVCVCERERVCRSSW